VAARLEVLDYTGTLDCVHCGLCLPHCPTYQETGRESSSPRGRIALMRAVAEGRLAIDDERVLEEAYFCLGCRACESACPAGVRYGHLVETLRAEIDASGARSRLRRMAIRLALRGVVGRPAGLRAAFAMLRLYQRSGLRRLAHRSGALRLLGPLREAEGLLPPVPPREALPVLFPARAPRRGRVALFTGCVMRELFAATNAATARVLARNGFEVEVPRMQRCCGALHQHAGDPEGAARLRRANRSAFRPAELDAVIQNSAGCGAALREAGDELAARVRDVSEFLHEVGLRPPPRELRLRVAYDDPCHLLHGQQVREAPRALLRSIRGLHLSDLPGTADCCGAAGIYNLTHPEMSRRLLERKVRALREMRPDAIATGNPGCLMQLARGVRDAGLPVEVVHPVDLLDRAYRGS
jgi:glycolate oxidase iron-sulfur subunit